MALGVLPIENLTEAETKQKAQYESELRVVQKKVRDIKAVPISGISARVTEVPWVRAVKVEEELRARGERRPISSVRASAH